MKAIKYEKYGGPEVLKMVETQKPKPTEHQILIRVISSSVTAADWHLRKADPFMVRIMNGMFKPKNQVLGQEFSGEIVEVGSNVTQFKTGELVFGNTSMKSGAYAEYIVLDEDSVITRIPRNIHPDKVATAPIGALAALHFLREAGIKSGQKVLVNGASGSVGTYAVQIAKVFGAEVTGVSSTSNVKMVQLNGADHVIDYKKMAIQEYGGTYDIIFDTVGNLDFDEMKSILTDQGYFTSTAFNPSLILKMIFNKKDGPKLYTGVTNETREDLETIARMISTGDVKPVIDKSYEMEEIREAHTYVESGRKRGNVIIKIGEVA